MKKLNLSLLGLALALMLVLSACTPAEPNTPDSSDSVSASDPVSENKPESSPTSESATESSTPESSIPDNTSSGNGSTPESKPAPSDIPGEITPRTDSRVTLSEQTVLGTQADLTRWDNAISTAGQTVGYVLVTGPFVTEPKGLTPEQVADILSTLASANLHLYNEIGNPPTGGNVSVLAFDSADKLLWAATYNGEWLTVEQGGTGYIFDGQYGNLDGLFNLLG